MSRILIVEDEPLQRTLLARHFRARKYDVACAADAVEAINALLCERCDLVLADIAMPYLDGIEFLQAVRGSVRTAQLPLVFLSGSSDTETRKRAMRNGATGFLAKPCPLDDVERAVASILRESPAGFMAAGLELQPLRGAHGMAAAA